MDAKIESLKIKEFTIRKNSYVTIDIWTDGSTIDVTVTDISMKNGEIVIESVTNLGSFITHSAEQWEDMLVKVNKY